MARYSPTTTRESAPELAPWPRAIVALAAVLFGALGGFIGWNAVRAHLAWRAFGVVGQRQLVDAVAGQCEFEQRARKTRTRLDQREQAARGHVQAAEGAAQVTHSLANQPVVLVGHKHSVHGQHGLGLA